MAEASTNNHHPPSQTTPRTSGRPIATTRSGDARLLTASPAAEPAPAPGVRADCVAQVPRPEVGPERVHEDELRVRELPEQEIRDPELPGRADEEIGIRHRRGVQLRCKRVLVDVLRFDACGDEPPRGLDELGAPAVVERDPEAQAVVPLGLALELRHALL